MKERLIIEFEKKPWLVINEEESDDVAELAEWKWPVKLYLVLEFKGELTPTRWISRSRLRECRVLLSVEPFSITLPSENPPN